MGEGPDYCAVTSVHHVVVGRGPHTTSAQEQGESTGKHIAQPPYHTRTLVPEVGSSAYRRAPVEKGNEHGLGFHITAWGCAQQ